MLQLRIPEPCHERWEDMRREERGRFCGGCQKTVVDLTTMSDREVLAYLARAGQGVCGRLLPEQLERKMELASSGRGGRRWWRWLVAGLLFSAEAQAQQRPKVEVVQRPVKPGGLARAVTAGMPLAQVKPLELNDSVRVQVLPEAVVWGYGSDRCSRLTGAVTYVRSITLYDTLKEKVTDTLSLLGLLSKKELTVYPNPVRRGMAASLSWEGMEAGDYEVGLFSTAGELVDLLGIPGSMAAGIYFLRIAGGGRIVSRKLVVL
jgi:hypothetical protein